MLPVLRMSYVRGFGCTSADLRDKPCQAFQVGRTPATAFYTPLPPLPRRPPNGAREFMFVCSPGFAAEPSSAWNWP